MKKFTLLFSFILFGFAVLPVSAYAQDKDVTKLKEVLVTADSENAAALPDVQGAKIYAGKKTSVISLQQAPQVVNSNYRQVLEKTPGLLISEESTPLFSAGYRGLNPDRGQFMQVLKDGIPIAADLFGYPEAYYTPPLDSIDNIEFIRGGSALMYGPQPGGAINFVTKDAYPGPLSLVTENSVGSHDFFSNYTGLSGTQDHWSHSSYFHHRQSQGFRELNSQYAVYSGSSKIKIGEEWTVALDLYNEEHGEPGGLTREDADAGSARTTRAMDRFELNRYYGWAGFEKEVSEDTFYDWKIFGGYLDRLSWRQRGGGFGTLPTGAAASSNDIQIQEFYTGGSDLRVRHHYDAWGQEGHTLTAGAFYYHSTSPRIEERGDAADAERGALRKDVDRSVNNVSFFAENLFRFGALSVTPGVRLENIWQGIEENFNVDKTVVPLTEQSEYDFVPLFGVGADYELAPQASAYGNVSQSYRPKVYGDALPLGTNQVVSGDLDEGESWQAETGVRVRPLPYLSADASVFYMEFNDQTGTVGNTITNVGDSEHRGAELAFEFDVLKAWEAREAAARDCSLNLFYNLTYLDAEFVRGPNQGKTPQYAPDYLMRGGVEYGFKDRLKARLAATFLDDHFADDSNSEQRIVPSYKVWDLTFEAKVYKDTVSVFGGVNNLFDEQYFARVSGAGIDPADGRNYYGGVKAVW